MGATPNKFRNKRNERFALLAASALIFLALPGCVSKATARKQAQQAFIAGQQQAMMRMQQQGVATEQGQPQVPTPSVTLRGNVRNSSVPWTPELTLAKALVEAEYTGPGDPTEIFLVRGGLARPVDVKQLLGGQDIPLQAGDLVQVK